MKAKSVLFSFFFSFLIFSVFPMFSQSDVQEILLPKKIYVGDEAELRYIFRSSLELFENSPELDEIILPLEKLPFDYDNQDFSLSKVVLQKNEDFYAISFILIAWKTGNVDIPSFDLLPFVFENPSSSLFINPSPFSVSSILSSSENQSLRPPLGPILAPGTVYFIWGIIILIVILAVFLFVLFINRRKIKDFIKKTLILSGYAKNSKKAIKELKRLEQKADEISDSDFSSAIQKILRKYFTKRFGTSFESVSTSELSKTFTEATGGFYNENQSERIAEITGLFMRTDYIRFAKNSLESRKMPSYEYETKFQKDEKKRLLETARNFIFSFEIKYEKKAQKREGGISENA